LLCISNLIPGCLSGQSAQFIHRSWRHVRHPGPRELTCMAAATGLISPLTRLRVPSRLAIPMSVAPHGSYNPTLISRINKVNKNNERQSLIFEANALNVFNQRAVTAYYMGMNSTNFATPLYANNTSIYQGAATYQGFETGYDPKQWINAPTDWGTPVTKSSLYGRPTRYQQPRSMRLQIRFTF